MEQMDLEFNFLVILKFLTLIFMFGVVIFLVFNQIRKNKKNNK